MSDAHRDEIAKLEALYADHPEGRIFTHLAEAYRKDGQSDRALEVLEDGLRRHPEYSSAHVVMGRVLRDLGRGDEAADEFRRVLELDGHNLIAVRALGDLARERGDTEAALGHYRQLLEIEPTDEVRQLVETMESPDSSVLEPVDPALDSYEPGPASSDAEADDWAPSHTPTPEAEDDSAAEPEPDRSPEAEEAEEAEFAASDFESLSGAGKYGGAADGDESDEGPVEWETGVLGVETEETGWSTGVESADEGGEGDEGDEDEEAFEPDDRWVGGADEDSTEEPEYEEAPMGDEPGTAAGSVDGGLTTETIAQVYARQGLYDRAVEVYRELVRTRPADDQLRERLAEMEELARAQAESAGEEMALTSAPDDEAESSISDLEAAPEFEADASPAPIEGFEPGTLDAGEIEAEPLAGLETEESDPDTGLMAGVEEDPGETGESEAMDVRDVPEPPEESPWQEPEAGAEAPDSGATESGVPEDSVWTEDWSEGRQQETPHAWATEEEEPDESPPIRSYFGGLLGWQPGQQEGPADDPVQNEPGERSDEASAETAAEAEAGPAGATTGEGAGEPAEGAARQDEDDDDLDMFRSWLESLKQ